MKTKFVLGWNVNDESETVSENSYPQGGAIFLKGGESEPEEGSTSQGGCPPAYYRSKIRKNDSFDQKTAIPNDFPKIFKIN